MSEFALTIIGCGSALPMHGRHPAAQVVTYEDLCCLVDCGEGTQERLRHAGIKPFKISIILISHLHGDHVYGLPGLLSTFSHLKRTEPLTVFGPVGLKGFLEGIIKYSELTFSYPLTIVERDPKKLNRILVHDHFEIFTFPLYHRIPCNGYLFKELKSNIKLKKDKLHELELSIEQVHALLRGEDIQVNGNIIANGELTFGSAPPISYAYCSDTKYDIRLVSWIRGVTVVYHETTFMNDMAQMAGQTGHSTAGEAGKIATAAGISCLITGHYSSRYKEVDPLVMEAGENFGNVIASEEGRKYNLRNLARGLSG